MCHHHQPPYNLATLACLCLDDFSAWENVFTVIMGLQDRKTLRFVCFFLTINPNDSGRGEIQIVTGRIDHKQSLPLINFASSESSLMCGESWKSTYTYAKLSERSVSPDSGFSVLGFSLLRCFPVFPSAAQSYSHLLHKWLSAPFESCGESSFIITLIYSETQL